MAMLPPTPPRRGPGAPGAPAVPANLDHLLLGTADLAEGVAWVADRLGVEAPFGGRHGNLGTANHLLSLGGDIYLEILGPDPEAPPRDEPLPFGIEGLAEPRLVTWAARGTDLAALVARASSRGVPLGPVRPGSRLRPDGSELSWEITAFSHRSPRWSRTFLHRLGNDAAPGPRDAGGRAADLVPGRTPGPRRGTIHPRGAGPGARSGRRTGARARGEDPYTGRRRG